MYVRMLSIIAGPGRTAAQHGDALDRDAGRRGDRSRSYREAANLTTISAAIAASASPQEVLPASMAGIVAGSSLAIDTGNPDVMEKVNVASVTGTSFSAIFKNSHGAGASIAQHDDVDGRYSRAADGRSDDVDGRYSRAADGRSDDADGRYSRAADGRPVGELDDERTSRFPLIDESSGFSYDVGDVVEIDDATGQAWIDAGHAEFMEDSGRGNMGIDRRRFLGGRPAPQAPPFAGERHNADTMPNRHRGGNPQPAPGSYSAETIDDPNYRDPNSRTQVIHGRQPQPAPGSYSAEPINDPNYRDPNSRTQTIPTGRERSARIPGRQPQDGPVLTTIAGPIKASTSLQAVAPASTDGIFVGSVLAIDIDNPDIAETVKVTAVSRDTFSAIFTEDHGPNINVSIAG